MLEHSGVHQGNEIAVIGMAGRFPGAANIEAFWKNLCAGLDSIPRVSAGDVGRQKLVAPEMVSQAQFVGAGGWLEDAERFDHDFFGMSTREAHWADPQLRIFLQCAWSALENASYDPHSFPGKVALYAGAGTSDYSSMLLSQLKDEPSTLFEAFVASAPESIATKTSFKLKLRGESVLVSTACSTGLVAAHMACQSLLLRQSDLALAGAVNVYSPQRIGYIYQEGMIRSPDGYCRSFDANAEGTVPGHGVGVVVLKRLAEALADRDHIYAVIRGSAINNDGDQKVGFTAPSVEGQADVIAEALAYAEVNPEHMAYVEAHGTGTRLGDPVEVAALTQAYRRWTPARRYCALASLKNNVGHLNTAAGIAGLMKVALSLHNEEIPPQAHFEQPNQAIDFDATPFFVNRRRKLWPRQHSRPRLAAVSSFGIGGTNAHMILEEAPLITRAASPSTATPQLLVLSARSEKALTALSQALAARLSEEPKMDLGDIAFTLARGRRAFHHRRAIMASSVDELRDALLAPAKPGGKDWTARLEASGASKKGVAFLFPGQDASFLGMGHGIYIAHPTFRKTMDGCAEILRPLLGYDVRERLYAPLGERGDADLTDPGLGLPALFATEYSLATLLSSWGIRPAAMFGHSFGEYVAAAVAQVISLEDGLALAALRGRLMSRMSEGAMLSVAMDAETVLRYLGGGCTLAAMNGPMQCVVSGPTVEVAALEQELRSRRVATLRLPVRRAFHSKDVEALMPELESALGSIELREPRLPYVSSLSGTWITSDEATSPAYWARQMREPVRFDLGWKTLLAGNCSAVLEVGPSQTLTGLARAARDGSQEGVRVLPVMRRRSDASSDERPLREVLGSLWLAGVEPVWSEVFAGASPRRIPLPTYPFEVDGREFHCPSAGELTLNADRRADQPYKDQTPSEVGFAIRANGAHTSSSLGERVLPLSCVQERTLEITRADPANPALNMQLAVELRGDLRRDLLDAALSDIVARHEVFRTAYLAEDGQQRPRLWPGAELVPAFADLRGAADPRAEALGRARAEVARPVDLSRAPAARVNLFRLDEQTHIFVLTMHHVICDAPSLGICFREMMTFYAARKGSATASVLPLPVQYSQYAQWQREHLACRAFESQDTYWRDKLAYLPASPELAGTRRSSAGERKNLRGARVNFAFGNRLTEDIRRVSKAEGVTPFWVLIATYAVLLHRLSGRDDIVIGTPIANRNRAEPAPLIGYVAHSLALRIDVSGDPTFGEVLKRVREVAMAAYGHPDVPFEWLSRELHPSADVGRSALFDALIVMHNEGPSRAKVNDLELEFLEVPDAPNEPSSFGAFLADLALIVTDTKSGYAGAFGYNIGVYERAAMERLVLQFTLLTADAMRGLGRRVSDLRLAIDGRKTTGSSGHSHASEAARTAPSFSLSYFASADAPGTTPNDKYALLVEGARFADDRGFEAIWTPERHFHAFGGLFPSPAVTSSALAALTKRIQIRAGSVVLPLHDPISVAEEWAVIDNLSGGRVGVSFASGWNATDFVLAPGQYPRRRAEMLARIESVRGLWRGEAVRRRDGNGNDIEVRVSPQPVQRELPIWLTAGGSPDTFRTAGKLGAGVLTNLLGQSIESLRDKIVLYRSAFRESGRTKGRGHVTLMLHTFLGSNRAEVRARVRDPLLSYLRTAVDHLTTTDARSQGLDVGARDIDQRDVNAVLERTFDRFLAGGGLFGSPEECLPMMRQLQTLDVDEVACLIDFGVDLQSTLESLERLDELREMTMTHLGASS